jgi:hypothetical protein
MRWIASIISVFLFICGMLTPTWAFAQMVNSVEHQRVALRMIGHQILLNANDSTSRVMPIVEDDGQFRIQFDSDFDFVPMELVNTVNRIVQETNLAQKYIVEVVSCDSQRVVYSYEVNSVKSKDIIPCLGRLQPKACYELLISLNQQDAIQIVVENNSNVVDESKSESNALIAFIVFLAISIIAIVLVVLKRHRKKKGWIHSNIIPLGNLKFDKINSSILSDNQKIDLTSKEADLLLLLHSNVNKTVERDVILNKVWGDEGDYVGRTLDVFISKLRKKLEPDPQIKIVNIRGVGYKLVLNN